MKIRRAWVVWMIVLSVCLEAAPVTVVTGGEKDRSGAMALRNRVVQLLAEKIPGESVALRKVRGVWLVEIGPLEMSEEERASLLGLLGREGFSPIVLSAPEKTGSALQRTEEGNRRFWQWGFLGLLAGAGVWFVIRRSREVRRLGGSQRELEKRQKRLRQEMEEGERRHG